MKFHVAVIGLSLLNMAWGMSHSLSSTLAFAGLSVLAMAFFVR